MWLIYAFCSSLFAGITSILAKCGIKKTDSTLATAIRTIVVVLFSWIMVFLVGSYSTLSSLTIRTWLFLILSGLATGASWLCYFKALQLGPISKVVPIDKSSTILTLLLAFIILKEPITLSKIIAIILLGLGTFLMISPHNMEQQKSSNTIKHSWLFFAILSAVFASLTTILGKLGIDGVESNLGTAIRTCVVLIMAWFMVFYQRKTTQLLSIDKKELCYICLSGFATGASWLCYYKALQNGITTAVVSIDKLSILFTILFSYFLFHEKIGKSTFIGVLVLVLGTLCLLLPF